MLEFSKEFKAVSHQRLLHKLKDYSVRGSLSTLQWIKQLAHSMYTVCSGWWWYIRQCPCGTWSSTRHSSRPTPVLVIYNWLGWGGGGKFHHQIVCRWLHSAQTNKYRNGQDYSSTRFGQSGSMVREMANVLQPTEVLSSDCHKEEEEYISSLYVIRCVE